jgi:hypothetical protein
MTPKYKDHCCHTETADSFLGTVTETDEQDYQDGGHDWGDCLCRSDLAFPLQGETV